MDCVATVVGGSLNLRTEPDKSSESRGSIPNGTTIPVSDLRAPHQIWLAAVYHNKLGYVMREYLDVDESETNYGVRGVDLLGEALLQEGSSGDKVIILQQILNTGDTGLSIDGDFGPATKAAVIEFQKNRDLDADGIVGTTTKGALYGFWYHDA